MTNSPTPSISDEKWRYLIKQFGVVLALAVVVLLIFKHADFGYDFKWTIIYEENPTYHEVFGFWLLRGLWLTIYISLISSVVSLILGTLFGIARLSRFKPLYYTATAYVEFFRNTPLLVQLFFWYFAIPMVLPEALRTFLYDHNFELISATTGLSIYTSAFIAEIVRAGIQAIPKGHTEAAASSGLNAVQALRYVILPQAFRIIIPPLGSEFLNNMKNSSLAMTIGVAELCWQSQQIESFTFRGFEATTAATVIYLSLSLIISIVMNSINHHLQIGPAKRLNGFDRFLAAVFTPFAWIGTALNRVIHKIADRPAGHANVDDSQTIYLSREKHYLKQSIKLLTVVGKIVFIIALIGFAVLLAKGLMNFNWPVAGRHLKLFLCWTFPDGSPGEILYGMGGLSLSIALAVISISASFFIGLAVGLGRMSKNPLINTPCILYIELIRGNPLIMVIFWVYFFSPIVTGMQINVFWSAAIAFTIFTGAYLGEIVRAGVSAIPFGQSEAAQSSGLSYLQTMRHIILPQALKIMIPAIVGQFIAIFKDTSLAYIIGVFELMTVAQTINNRLMIYPFEIYITVAVLYFICCYSMSLVAARLEKKYSPA